VATSEGRLLIFPMTELPKLVRGKGHKLINISAQRAANREEFLVALAAIPPDSCLTLVAGQQNLVLKPKDLAAYQGTRGSRGNKLPKAWQHLQALIPNRQ
jgi:topoisomerase-4 subunit A